MDQTAVRVAAVRDCGPDAVAIEFETPAGFDARPGQFVKLTATLEGEDVSRFYTISSPDVDDTFETTVGYDPDEGGPFSEYLLAIEAGDEVTLAGPFGNDYYEDEPRVVVLAGGPGIGPAVGIAERAIADGGEAAVVYVDDQPLHEDRLATLAEHGATVETYGQDDEDAFGTAVQDVLTGGEGEQVFVYGFADFLERAEAAIEAAGGEYDEAKAENFG
ncbi:FAD-dependent oxidoreductase [Salinirubellus salinus]|uniref:FAD-dependent oxidoreductase n=1 Tax=Salinirubellus salinus TaxID=1364945 RepID=A0A9E7R4Y2_9EURY|nr:FAD-dependent oxidoreductase [Salinirubellus salinus]UWM55955.1 FAD-dependent oxidoreductase [Salinirubellus salinus]